MNDTRRTAARLSALAGFAIIAASGCLLQLPAPEINLHVEPAYNDQEILIPYELYGEGRYARARWTLSVFTGVEFEEIESREIRIPSGSSGVLQLGELPEALFRLDFALLTTRDGSYETVPYITRRAEFYVDRTAPEIGGIFLQYYQDGAPATPINEPAVGTDSELEIEPPPFAPEFESPNRILYTLNEPRPPIPGQDEYDGIIWLWGAAEGSPSADVTIVVVDEAGNRSDTRVESWP